MPRQLLGCKKIVRSRGGKVAFGGMSISDADRYFINKNVQNLNFSHHPNKFHVETCPEPKIHACDAFGWPDKSV